MTYCFNRNGLLACCRSLRLPSTALLRPWTVPQRSHSFAQPLPPRMTIARAARLFRSSKLTSNELCQHSYNLAFFGENSLHLNSYAKLLPLEQILQQASQSDERIRTGNSKGFLDGIPVTIKANIAVGRYWEMPNACSAILSIDEDELHDACTDTSDEIECTPVYESDIARRLLKDCGAVLIGITNMDEFGMGSLGVNNGLHRGDVQQKRCSPTYNPVPWMQRIASLLNSNQDRLKSEDENDDDDDEYWLEAISNSTLKNPHGIADESCLAELLEEVQHWIRGENNRHPEQSPLISPGGSSSGAAVTASHGSSLLSIGTDTGGSLRLPSAWTSTVGFKPSYGTFSRYGVVSYVSSLDTIGFITGSTECAEIAWRCLGVESKEDRTNNGGIMKWNAQLSRDSTARVYHNESNFCVRDSHLPRILDQHEICGVESMSVAEKPLTNIRVGIPAAFSLEEIPPSIATAWSESAWSLQNVGGATIVAISESKLPPALVKLALASYYVLACAEASSNLSRYDGLRFGANVNLDALYSEHDIMGLGPLFDMTALEQQISANRVIGFGGETQRRVLAGTSVLSSDRFHTHYEAAAVARAKISRSIDNVFRSSLEHDEDDDKVDVMLVPTALTFPPKLKSNGDGVQLDPTAAFSNDVMTIPISLGGYPSISVPVNVGRLNMETDCPKFSVSNMIGMQVFASRGSDDLVLRVASALQ